VRDARSKVDAALAGLPAVRATAQSAAAARAEAWWAANARWVYAAGGLTAAVLIWRTMFGARTLLRRLLQHCTDKAPAHTTHTRSRCCTLHRPV
jgi:Tfp pilus assembly protein PilV